LPGRTRVRQRASFRPVEENSKAFGEDVK
jgi:hypothetical protein